MTAQEAYEFQREYFSRPDAILSRGSREDENQTYMCYYRKPGTGAGCAVGCFMTGENAHFYNATMDDSEQNENGTGFAELMEMDEATPFHDFLFEGLIGDEYGQLWDWLESTQFLHDDKEGTHNAADFVRRLDIAAKDFGLTVVTT